MLRRGIPRTPVKFGHSTVGIPYLVRNDKAKKESLVFFGHCAGEVHGREQHEDVCLKQGNK